MVARGVRTPWQLVVSCPTWCWELKSGPLQEQYVGGLNCLAISPTPQPSHILAFKIYVYHALYELKLYHY